MAGKEWIFMKLPESGCQSPAVSVRAVLGLVPLMTYISVTNDWLHNFICKFGQRLVTPFSLIGRDKPIQ